MKDAIDLLIIETKHGEFSPMFGERLIELLWDYYPQRRCDGIDYLCQSLPPITDAIRLGKTEYVLWYEWRGYDNPHCLPATVWVSWYDPRITKALLSGNMNKYIKMTPDMRCEKIKPEHHRAFHQSMQLCLEDEDVKELVRHAMSETDVGEEMFHLMSIPTLQMVVDHGITFRAPQRWPVSHFCGCAAKMDELLPRLRVVDFFARDVEFVKALARATRDRFPDVFEALCAEFSYLTKRNRGRL